jgi:hypothetical protein
LRPEESSRAMQIQKLQVRHGLRDCFLQHTTRICQIGVTRQLARCT